MSTRERWLAAMCLRPVDRLPFWPKLGTAYTRAYPEHEAAADVGRMMAWVGGEPPAWIGPCVAERRSRTSVTVQAEGLARRTLFHTPFGDLTQAERFDEGSHSWHPTEFPVKRVEDVRRMTAFFEDVRVEPDPAAREQARARMAAIGEGAVAWTGIGESPLMHWVEWIAGVENAHLLLAEQRETVETLFAAMQRVLVERARGMAEHCPADALQLTENTSTTLISPEQYRRYCLPQIREIATAAGANGHLVVLHMCGHLKALLPDLATLPVHAFEAFTAPPLGNTRLVEGRAACPQTCLIGGTHATLWLRPAAEIIAFLERELDALPHHRGLVPSSAGMMPPGCPPEAIRTVIQWVHGYRVR